MGSNAVNLDEDLCCPVCRKPLSSPGTPPKPKLHKIGRGKGRAPHLHNTFQAQRDTRMAIGKFKDNEEVVIAQCGHLFHKFCLRHYCYLVREGRSNHMYKVTCPCCDRQISMISQTVDYRAHQEKLSDRDKDFTKTNIMNNELSGQMLSVQQKLQRVESSIEDGNHNLEIYRSHWRKLRKELKNIKSKRLDIENMYSEIERSEQMLKCMQNQQLKIVKKFIAKVKEKSPDEYINFPRRLANFLHLIEEDDRLVRDLGEIIVPIHLNHLKSDRQSLLKGIIAAVHEKVLAQSKTQEIPANLTTTDQRNRKTSGEEPKKTAIFVKVRKSSISILSSTSLTRESIHQIMQKVDINSLHRPRQSHGSVANKKLKQAEKVSNNDASVSDIQILYMPKRKMVEQTSEPYRTIEENESYAKVPPRRCKSTDAVLIKTKKIKETSMCNKVSSPQSKKIVEEKRSSTAAVMLAQMGRNEGISANNGTCLPSIVKIVKTYDNDGVSESRKSNHEEVEVSDAKTAGGSKATFENTQIHVPKPSSALPTESGSLLKLIYDNLVEDCNSNRNLESQSKLRDNTVWNDLDDNNNELLRDIIGNRSLSKNRSDTSTQFVAAQPPQFFRVDRRGIARPESPHSTQFRQPSFLSDLFNQDMSENCFTSVHFQPDEENQLNALSPEEMCLISSEREAYLSSRRNCGASSRRPMYHGTPACIGMLDSKSNFGTLPEPHHVPFYLKKWQQQLNSRKVLKAIPRRIANYSIRSTRLVNSPKSDRSTFYNAPLSRGQASSSSLRQNEQENFSESGGIQLPPLSMYPAKRPTTAQCNNLSFSCPHREGPEREISSIYNYDSIWK